MTQNVSPRQPEGGRAGGGRSPLELPHVRELLLKTRLDPELRMYKWYQEEYWEGLPPRERTRILLSAFLLHLGETQLGVGQSYVAYDDVTALEFAREIARNSGVKIFGGIKFVAVQPHYYYPYILVFNFVNPYREAWKWFTEPEGRPRWAIHVWKFIWTKEYEGFPHGEPLYIGVNDYLRLYGRVLRSVCKVKRLETCSVVV